MKKRNNGQRTAGNGQRETFLIVETIFSTLDEKGTPNFAPMGIGWGEEQVVVRPYRATQTFRNLASNGCGVANISDDALAFVKCGLLGALLPHFPAACVPGVVFRECCSWLELTVLEQGGSKERAEFKCRIEYRGRQRDFIGFCRAGGAVLEAAILATRFAFCDRARAREDLKHYMNIVDKTGDQKEKDAMLLIQDYIRKWEGQ